MLRSISKKPSITTRGTTHGVVRTTGPTAGLLRGRCLWRAGTRQEGSSTAQPVSALPQEDDPLSEGFDLFGPGPAFPKTSAPVGVVQESDAQGGSVEDRMKHLTSVVQELARLITTGVAAPSAQPLEGAAHGAPAASSTDALDPYKPRSQIPMLKLRTGLATQEEPGPPPDSPSSPSSGSSSSEDEDKPACRMCGSTKHHEKDCAKLTANKKRKKDGPPRG